MTLIASRLKISDKKALLEQLCGTGDRWRVMIIEAQGQIQDYVIIVQGRFEKLQVHNSVPPVVVVVTRLTNKTVGAISLKIKYLPPSFN